jgi:hypothetical protein
MQNRMLARLILAGALLASAAACTSLTAPQFACDSNPKCKPDQRPSVANPPVIVP